MADFIPDLGWLPPRPIGGSSLHASQASTGRHLVLHCLASMNVLTCAGLAPVSSPTRSPLRNLMSCRLTLMHPRVSYS